MRLPWPPITSPRARKACPRKSCIGTGNQRGREGLGVQSQPSPAATTRVFRGSGTSQEPSPGLCFKVCGGAPKQASLLGPVITLNCSPGCHPTPHFHPPHPAQPASASPSAGPSSGREERGAMSKRHRWETEAGTGEEDWESGFGPKKVEKMESGLRVWEGSKQGRLERGAPPVCPSPQGDARSPVWRCWFWSRRCTWKES